jgi:hypothetical protein
MGTQSRRRLRGHSVTTSILPDSILPCLSDSILPEQDTGLILSDPILPEQDTGLILSEQDPDLILPSPILPE